MTARSPRRGLLVAGVLTLAVLAVLGAAAHAQRPTGTVIDVLEIDGIIDPPVASAIQDTIGFASASGGSAVLLDLDSPGALSVDLSLLTPVLESDVPVIVWVGPGAVAEGGAAFLAAAADLLVVAPSARVGPAIPFELGAGEPGSADPARGEGLTDYTKLRRTVLDDHPHPAATARDLSVEAFSAEELVRRGIAAQIADTRDLGLAALSGTVVRKSTSVFALDVRPDTTTLRGHELSVSRRLLHASSDPAVAFLLLVAGIAALLLLPVRAGSATLALGLLGPFVVFGLVAVPAQWWAIALLVTGMVFVAFDAGIVWLGVPTAIGLGCFVLGGLTLVGGAPRLAVPVPEVLALAALGGVVSLLGRRRQDRLIAAQRAAEEALATQPVSPAPI